MDRFFLGQTASAYDEVLLTHAMIAVGDTKSSDSLAHRIVELDGWRGVSVLLVLLGHMISFRFLELFRGQPHLAELGDMWSRLGVHVFFCISGFVITRILLRQESEKRLSLRWFYTRRAFKIFPPLMLYLLALAGLFADRALQSDVASLAKASLFLCNTPVFGDCGFFVEHTWSLAVEEQFYLLFPISLILIPQPARTAVFGFLLGALSFCSGLKNYLHLGNWIDNAGAFACIVAGVLTALNERRLRPLVARVPAGGLVTVLVLLLLSRAPHTNVSVLFYAAFRPLLICGMLLLNMEQDSFMRKMLVSRPLQYLGVVSYSLYIWQQLFLGREYQYAASPWLGGIPWALPLAALLCYRLLEKPLTALGRELSEPEQGIDADPSVSGEA